MYRTPQLDFWNSRYDSFTELLRLVSHQVSESMIMELFGLVRGYVYLRIQL
jgi:hypothetical protein